MRIPLKYLVPAAMFAALAFVCYALWSFYIVGPWTRDGRVSADIAEVAAEVSGTLARLHIKDNVFVSRNDLLVEIDPKDYEFRLRAAQARLEEAVLRRDNASLQYARRQRARGAVSREDLDNAQAQLAMLEASVAQLRTALEQAQLDLERTKIYAPVDGFITNLTLREGNYIRAGQSMFALVDSDSFHVVAYFEETKMPYVTQGKRVEIIPYDGGETLTGVISGYGRAIVDQSSSTGPQLVRNVQPTYPWVRLAQRVPVRVAIDGIKEKGLHKTLVSGTTCTVKILE